MIINHIKSDRIFFNLNNVFFSFANMNKMPYFTLSNKKNTTNFKRGECNEFFFFLLSNTQKLISL